MIQYLWILPLAYTVLFLFYTFLKVVDERLDKVIFCSVCAAWFTFLIVGFLLSFEAIVLMFMLGMTATGIAKYGSDYGKDKNIMFLNNFFLMQLTTTFIGLLIIMYKYT